MKRIIILFAITLSLSASAQDIHFTMFHASPIVMNPASAGVFEGTFRASTNYKSQWGSVANPYSTFSLTADGSFWKNRMGNAHMGAGINLYRDVAGATNFGTTKINISLSSILANLLDAVFPPPSTEDSNINSPLPTPSNVNPSVAFPLT